MAKKLRYIATFIVAILFGPRALFSYSIDIISSLKIKIPPAIGQFYETLSTPPIYVFQGLKEEILIWRGAFFAIYSSEGKFLKKMGGEGEGPGEFFVIVDFRKTKDRYCVLDVYNKLSVFDKDFNFINRIRLEGEKTSNIVFSFDINNDLIFTAQRWVEDAKNRAKCKTINLYDLNGKWLNAFFPIASLWKNYPSDSILGGIILSLAGYIYIAFRPINKIWQLAPNGQIIKEKSFAEGWWHKIKYNKKDEDKARKQGIFRKFYEEVTMSGDMITKLYIYNENILVSVLRGDPDNPSFYIFLLDPTLQKEIGPLNLKDYFFCGADKNYIYFAKYIKEALSARDEADIELLRCSLKF